MLRACGDDNPITPPYVEIEMTPVRWFVFRQFEAIVGPWWAVLAAALAFTTHHVVALAGQFDTGLAIVGSVGVFTGGVTWSWLYRRYGSIWPGYVSHALVDVAVFAIGYQLIFG